MILTTGCADHRGQKYNASQGSRVMTPIVIVFVFHVVDHHISSTSCSDLVHAKQLYELSS